MGTDAVDACSSDQPTSPLHLAANSTESVLSNDLRLPPVPPPPPPPPPRAEMGLQNPVRVGHAPPAHAPHSLAAETRRAMKRRAVTSVEAVLRDAATRHPDRTAFESRDGETRVTFGGLKKDAGARAKALKARGIQAGQRVGVVENGGIGVWASMFALSSIGAIPVMLPEDAEKRDAAITGLNVDPIITEPRTPSALHHDQAAPDHGPAGVGPIVVCTSGSTGTPKLVEIPAGKLMAGVASRAKPTGSAPERMLLTLPAWHSFAPFMVLTAMHDGDTVVLSDSSAGIHALRDRNAHRMPFACGTLGDDLRDAIARKTLPQHAITLIGNGLSCAARQKIEQQLAVEAAHDVRIITHLGSTEMPYAIVDDTPAVDILSNDPTADGVVLPGQRADLLVLSVERAADGSVQRTHTPAVAGAEGWEVGEVLFPVPENTTAPRYLDERHAAGMRETHRGRAFHVQGDVMAFHRSTGRLRFIGRRDRLWYAGESGTELVRPPDVQSTLREALGDLLPARHLTVRLLRRKAVDGRPARTALVVGGVSAGDAESVHLTAAAVANAHFPVDDIAIMETLPRLENGKDDTAAITAAVWPSDPP